MLGSNIKYYRLKNNLTLRELANKTNLSPMALSNYENNKRRPNNKIISKIVSALNINLNDLLTTYDTTNINIKFEDYSLNNLSKIEKEYIDVLITDHLSRYFQILNFADIKTDLLINKEENYLTLSNNSQLSAQKLREYLNISKFGPIDIIEILELNNIITIPISYENNFLLSTGKANSTRFIAYNNKLDEIIYKHIVYLLIELYFKSIESFPKSLIKDIYIEFLLPSSDLSDLLLNNKTYNQALDFKQKKYHIQINDYIYYLKKKKIFNGKFEEKIFYEINYKRFDILLQQIYENNFIDKRKYYELKKIQYDKIK